MKYRLQIALLVCFASTYFPHLTPANCAAQFMIPETLCSSFTESVPVIIATSMIHSEVAVVARVVLEISFIFYFTAMIFL